MPLAENIAQGIPLDEWTTGDRLKHEHLNQPVKALQQLTRGLNNPSQGAIVDGLRVPTGVRLVITNSATARSGLAVIDGVTPIAGDLILYATGGTPGNDGIYEAQAGNWPMLWRISYAQTGNGIPVLPHNWAIAVGDGSTGPRIFVTGINGTTRSF